MLIDAAHAEETRVVVADEKRLVDYDHESSTKKQIKGNFYLAKVTRVEPSLQAAFVDFGGNSHGFLAFNEIHPDYYKIPVEDRDALLENSKAEADADDNDDESAETNGTNVEVLGGDETEDIERAGEAQRKRIRSAARQYKIQEVIKRRQILLVQVVKEERGNKGAALTTYLSLAGRYCVLMPNTARGGGISRKITTPQHRKRLRSILQYLEVPSGMGVILRTAGVERSKAEIKRDYEYLRRVWDEIREKTLESTAPAQIHEEGNVIKRALRDLYAREIEEILIDGDEAYKTAREFMKMMVPSHVKRIQKYDDDKVPMYLRYGIEAQLDSIHEQNVHLPSGGYIVINSTEALVAIDVNSGRATRQRNIEQTALHTNLEAADEVARQLRLRDLAGLIVIDFIDMEEHRNNSSVERRMKEAMRMDRARIQVGHISHFGLLELSRQRLRPSLVEASTHVCEICGGAGVIRSTESTSLKVLRAIEEEGRGARYPCDPT
jgi:ribonuclease E